MGGEEYACMPDYPNTPEGAVAEDIVREHLLRGEGVPFEEHSFRVFSSVARVREIAALVRSAGLGIRLLILSQDDGSRSYWDGMHAVHVPEVIVCAVDWQGMGGTERLRRWWRDRRPLKHRASNEARNALLRRLREDAEARAV